VTLSSRIVFLQMMQEISVSSGLRSSFIAEDERRAALVPRFMQDA
jgi:hypothetical protein